MPIFASNVPLVSPVFLKRSLVFPILLFSSIFLHCSLQKAFLSLLSILWDSGFNWVYLSFSPLPFASLLSHLKVLFRQLLCILAFIFGGMVLVNISCAVLQISVHSSSSTLSIRSSPLNLFVTSTYNHKGFNLGHTQVA